MLEQAATIFESFIQKAGSAPEFAVAVKRSKDRAQDIRDTVKFIKEGQTAAAIEAARQEREGTAMPTDEGAETPPEGGGDQGAGAPPPPPAAPPPAPPPPPPKQ
jgi:hypothetical protein